MAIVGPPPDGQPNVELPHPSAAMVAGTAKADNGERVGVYGYSEANKGVYAESRDGTGLLAKGGELAARFEGGIVAKGAPAARFEGGVTVTGTLTVGSTDLLKLVQQLQQQVQELQQSGRTNEGGPIARPSRPTIDSIEQAPQPQAGQSAFTVKGSGFTPSGQVTIKITNSRTQETSEPVRSADGTGVLFAGAIWVNCVSGDRLTFSATDKRRDLNDVTGALWTLPKTHTVS